MKNSVVLLAAEFKQKSRWTYVWPTVSYGAMFLPYGVGRGLVMKGVNWVTRDSNRLSNFPRYSVILNELDAAKNEEELKVTPQDVRWNDHRRLFFRCTTCGEAYRKAVTSKVKFHAGCPSCKKKMPSEVLKYQVPGAPLVQSHPDLAKQLAGPFAENIAKFAASSKFEAKWTCSCCQKEYKAPIRMRTGVVEADQAPVSPLSSSWSAFCPECRWAKNMAPIGQQTAQKLQYLGLDVARDAPASQSTSRIPRRKRFDVL